MLASGWQLLVSLTLRYLLLHVDTTRSAGFRLFSLHTKAYQPPHSATTHFSCHGQIGRLASETKTGASPCQTHFQGVKKLYAVCCMGGGPCQSYTQYFLLVDNGILTCVSWTCPCPCVPVAGSYGEVPLCVLPTQWGVDSDPHRLAYWLLCLWACRHQAPQVQVRRAVLCVLLMLCCAL